MVDAAFADVKCYAHAGASHAEQVLDEPHGDRVHCDREEHQPIPLGYEGVHGSVLDFESVLHEAGAEIGAVFVRELGELAFEFRDVWPGIRPKYCIIALTYEVFIILGCYVFFMRRWVALS